MLGARGTTKGLFIYMSKEKTTEIIIDSNRELKDFTIISNLIYELPLKPLEIALYFHYKRWAYKTGDRRHKKNAQEPVKKLMKKYAVGSDKIKKARNRLVEIGLAEVDITGRPYGNPDVFEIVDISDISREYFKSNATQREQILTELLDSDSVQKVPENKGFPQAKHKQIKGNSKFSTTESLSGTDRVTVQQLDESLYSDSPLKKEKNSKKRIEENIDNIEERGDASLFDEIETKAGNKNFAKLLQIYLEYKTAINKFATISQDEINNLAKNKNLDTRILEIVIAVTQCRSKFKVVNSFKYFLPVLDEMFTGAKLNSRALNARLASVRKGWVIDFSVSAGDAVMVLDFDYLDSLHDFDD